MRVKKAVQAGHERHAGETWFLSAHSESDGAVRVHGGEGRERPMSTYPQVHVRMATIGLPLTTVTILMNDDSPATVASQLDTLESLIAQYGAHAFWGEPNTESPRQTA